LEPFLQLTSIQPVLRGANPTWTSAGSFSSRNTHSPAVVSVGFERLQLGIENGCLNRAQTGELPVSSGVGTEAAKKSRAQQNAGWKSQVEQPWHRIS